MRQTNRSLHWSHPEPSSTNLLDEYELEDISMCSSSCSSLDSSICCTSSACDRCRPRFPRATAPEIRFTFTSPAANVIIVSQGGSVLYTMKRASGRWHCWQLLNSQGNEVAKFRASQAFSWLVLVDETGKKLAVGQPWWNASRLEWKLGNKLFIRWCQGSLGMLLIRDAKVQLPQAAAFNVMPCTLPARANELYTCLTWRPPVSAVERAALQPAVVSTAFIAMWKWSREPRFYEDVRGFFAKHCIQWLLNSVSLDPTGSASAGE